VNSLRGLTGLLDCPNYNLPLPLDFFNSNDKPDPNAISPSSPFNPELFGKIEEQLRRDQQKIEEAIKNGDYSDDDSVSV
jgi:hypothetical protein